MDLRNPSAETLMRQAGYSAEEWLWQAVEAIDKQFGEGYAKENPALVGAFMQAAGADEIAMHVRSLLDTFDNMTERLSNTIESLEFS